MYSFVDTDLASKLGLSLDHACTLNTSIYEYRPIAFASVADPNRFLRCGWTAGPSGLRAFACVGALAAGVLAALNILRLKRVPLQYAATGAAAVFAVVFFIAVIVDGHAVNTAAYHPLCVNGNTRQDPSRKYECTAGRYVAVVVLDMLLAIVLAAFAAVSFFFVQSGQFATEVAEASVDYFGEAERYFPDNPDTESDSLAK